MIDDDHERVQRILEGRCELCNTKLPEHDYTCELSPEYNISEKLDGIQKELYKKIDDLTRLIKTNKITAEEFIELLDERLNRKF